MTMSSDMQQMPFVKQLAANDRPTRDAALSSLETYLTSTHTFTPLDLLKLWKGLFFCMWHSDRPRPQQALALSLSYLVLPLSPELFLPFLRAFWITMAREWTSIDALRLDKFLRLIRYYINAAFTYISRRNWDPALLTPYLQLISEIPLSATDMKVPDGLKYHVLDVWREELEEGEGEGDVENGVPPVKEVMGPVKLLIKDGKTKKMRERAGEALGDVKNGEEGEKEGSEDEWEGLGD